MVIVILIDSFFCGFYVELEYRRKGGGEINYS